MCVSVHAYYCRLLFINYFHVSFGPKTVLHYKSKQKGKLSHKENKQTKYCIQTFTPQQCEGNIAHVCQEHLFQYKCSLSPTSLLQTENSFFKIKNKPKPRKARKFKFRADIATSLTPPKFPHKDSKVQLAWLS